jgi:hypothetical protein
MKKSVLLFAVLALSASSSFARELAPGEIQAPLWVDLNDVATYRPDLMPDASIILKSMKDDTAKYAPDKAQVIGEVELQDYPMQNADQKGITYRSMTALMTGINQQMFFRFFSVHVNDLPDGRQVTDVSIQKDLPLSQAKFMVNVGLIQRMVILNDIQDNIEIIYPLGVGGVDPDILDRGTSLLTPLFTDAVLKRKTVIKALGTPTYYRNLPYMPITNKKGVLMPIAFHISILSDDDWTNRGGNYLVRGFESHGCMRLREKDLKEFFNIVEQGALDEIPVNVGLLAFNIGSDEMPAVQDGVPSELNPYPMTVSSYEEVKNFAAPGEKPFAQRDLEEHLVILQDAAGQPDFSGLVGFSADEISDLKAFEGITEAFPEPEKDPQQNNPLPSLPAVSKARGT